MKNIKLGFSPLDGRVYIYRHGKNPKVALDRRDATDEIITFFMHYFIHEGESEQIFTLGDKKFRVLIERYYGEI